MKTICYGLALSLVLVAGLAGAQTIDEIQVYNEETGAPESPFDGQSVTVEGTIYVVKGTYNGGTFYIQSDNGGIQSFAPGAPGWAVPGKIVSVTGTVGTFSGEIQITNNPTFADQGDNPNLEPLEVTVDELLINPGNPLLYGDYEKVGEYIAVTGTVVATDIDGVGSDVFYLGGTNDDLQVYIDDTVIESGVDASAVQIGDEYRVLGPCVNFNGEIEIKPRYQSDLIEDPTLPVILSVNAENWVPRDDDDITIIANVTDDVGIASGELFYRDSDGENPGAWNSVPMTQTRNETWAGTIPDPHDERQVDFYVAITDAEAQTVLSPGSAPQDFFSVAIGVTPIYDVQETPDGEDGDSPLLDQVVNIRGVITVGTNDFGGTTDSRFVVQEQEPARDGTYRWGAILVYESSGANEYFRGDLVEVGGYVDEFNELTELNPHNPSAINLVDFADPPPPTAAMTATLADSSLGEAYESVWVRTYAAQVIDVDALPARFEVSDTGAQEDSVTVDPTIELLYVPMLGDILHVEGFMDSFFDNRDLQPIDDQFVVLLDVTAADDPLVPSLGGFKGIYPNPFNPMAKISFAVVRPSLVQLNVYDVRGIRVRSLVQDNLEAGDYNLTWDGRSDAGRELASGTYFARLRIGAEVLQVRKLQLVK